MSEFAPKSGVTPVPFPQEVSLLQNHVNSLFAGREKKTIRVSLDEHTIASISELEEENNVRKLIVSAVDRRVFPIGPHMLGYLKRSAEVIIPSDESIEPSGYITYEGRAIDPASGNDKHYDFANFSLQDTFPEDEDKLIIGKAFSQNAEKKLVELAGINESLASSQDFHEVVSEVRKITKLDDIIDTEIIDRWGRTREDKEKDTEYVDILNKAVDSLFNYGFNTGNIGFYEDKEKVQWMRARFGTGQELIWLFAKRDQPWQERVTTIETITGAVTYAEDSRITPTKRFGVYPKDGFILSDEYEELETAQTVSSRQVRRRPDFARLISNDEAFELINLIRSYDKTSMDSYEFPPDLAA